MNSALFNAAGTRSRSAGVKAFAGADTAVGAGCGCARVRRRACRAAIGRDTPVHGAAPPGGHPCGHQLSVGVHQRLAGAGAAGALSEVCSKSARICR